MKELYRNSGIGYNRPMRTNDADMFIIMTTLNNSNILPFQCTAFLKFAIIPHGGQTVYGVPPPPPPPTVRRVSVRVTQLQQPRDGKLWRRHHANRPVVTFISSLLLVLVSYCGCLRVHFHRFVTALKATLRFVQNICSVRMDFVHKICKR